MHTNTAMKTACVALCFCGMVTIFFFQARVALRPVGLTFQRPPIAYGYSNVTFSGYVYTNEGMTTVGLGSGVALSINGAAASTTTTDALGYYQFTSLSISAHDIVTVFVNNETMDGALVAKFNDTTLDGSMSGMNIYGDRLIVRSSGSSLSINTANLNTADNSADTDIASVYTLNGNNLMLGNAKELLVWDSSVLRSSGSIFTHDVDVRGTMVLGGNNVTASGSFAGSGVITMTGTLTLTSTAPLEEISLYGQSVGGDLTINNGLLEYWKFDEGSGTNASGSSLVGTGGSLVNMSSAWAQTNTGTTTFFNPYALEFDGTNDHIDFGNKFDIASGNKRTFAGWFRRKSATTEDVILAKRAGSGAAAAGYVLYLDDADDKLHFEVSDGTDEYRLSSTTTFTDENWHHFAVRWSTLKATDAGIFIDGADDSASTSGTFANIGTITNSSRFFIGEHSASGSSFMGTLDDMRIYHRLLTGSEIASLGAGMKTTGSGVYVTKNDLDVDGDLSVIAGTLNVSGGNHPVQVAGDLNVYGNFLTQSGTVTLNGGNQVIRGSTAFRHLVKTVTSAKSLTFESNAQQTVSGSLTLDGEVNNLLSLRATVAGTDTYLRLENPGGGQTLEFLDVKDNNAGGGETLVCTVGCADSGNNTNWEFGASCGDGVLNTGESCDDGNSSNTDTCLNTCVSATCGDGYVRADTETCDPPDGGNCLSNCQLRNSGGGGAGHLQSAASQTNSYYRRPAPPDGCGDNVVDKEKGEECDRGLKFNGLGVCSYECKLLFCGDGVVSANIGEECEPVKQGGTFVVATCGEICTAPEVIDGRSKRYIGGCKRTFLPSCAASNASASLKAAAPLAPLCGNGFKEGSEECDYGGSCIGGQFDGSFWTDRESAKTCQNGGGTTIPKSDDGCSADCKTEFCGDGIVQPKGSDNVSGTADDEECDNGGNNSAKDRTCGNTCKNVQFVPASVPSSAMKKAAPLPSSSVRSSAAVAVASPRPVSYCGNGIVERDEQCDGTPACTPTCLFAVRSGTCGNGFVDAGEQCDDGNRIPGDGCTMLCQFEERLPSVPIVTIASVSRASSSSASSEQHPQTISFVMGVHDDVGAVVSAQSSALRERSSQASSAPPNVRQKVPTPVAQPKIRVAPYDAALITPYALRRPPAGDTGPGLVMFAAAGAAAGVGWMRRRRRR